MFSFEEKKIKCNISLDNTIKQNESTIHGQKFTAPKNRI